MKILARDFSHDRMKVKVDTTDDLWHLTHIVEQGDVVEALTQRKMEARDDLLRPEKAEKRTVYLGLMVEKVEFHKYSNRLRLTGTIVSGEDVGNYHTINVEEGTVLTIIKRWKRHHMERVEEAVSATNAPKILIIALEEGQADIGVVRQYGVDFAGEISRNISGKHETKNREAEKEEFFNEISKKISEYDLPTLVAGPGFAKEEFRKYYEEKFGKKIFVESCSSTGRTGIYEVLKKGLVSSLYKEDRLTREIGAVEELFGKIISDMAVYGIGEVERALSYGALERLLILDTYLRSEKKTEHILETARRTNCQIMVISSEHEGGDRLAGLGSIAGILRFKI
jgi:protein pelota